jgi:hypothetical protein
MKAEVFVGIDVSKDRLDVQVRPLREAFAVKRDDGGLEELIARLRGIGPALVRGFALRRAAIATAAETALRHATSIIENSLPPRRLPPQCRSADTARLRAQPSINLVPRTRSRNTNDGQANIRKL